jgi:hypothetical protein
MALVKCRECGHQISKSAKSCPQCGAKTKQTSLIVKALVILFLVAVLAPVVLDRGTRRQVQAPSAPAQPLPPRQLTPEEKAADEKRRAQQEEAAANMRKITLGLKWDYREEPDELGRGAIKRAFINSVNEIEFGFPYSGPQRARLELRVHPEWGRDVMLRVERGQFLCHQDDCSVTVRFDDGKPQVYSGVGPEDLSSDVIFLHNYSRFVSNLRKAKKLQVEAQFYREGRRIFEFETDGFVWKDAGQ